MTLLAGWFAIAQSRKYSDISGDWDVSDDVLYLFNAFSKLCQLSIMILDETTLNQYHHPNIYWIFILVTSFEQQIFALAYWSQPMIFISFSICLSQSIYTYWATGHWSIYWYVEVVNRLCVPASNVSVTSEVWVYEIYWTRVVYLWQPWL